MFANRTKLALMAALAMTPAHSAQADVPNVWQASFAGLRGDDSCKYGAADCNRCVYEVERQFRDLTQRSAHTRRVKEWEWNRLTDYAPSGLKPTDVLTILPTDLDNFDARHFQSFVRAANDDYGAPDLFATYAGNAQKPSGLFASRGGADGRGRITDGPLKYLYDGTSDHPGGMQAVGRYLLIANEEEYTTSTWTDSHNLGWLEVLDTRDMPHDDGDTTYLRDASAAANVAAAKLASGGYLVVVNVTSYHNRYRFYYTPTLRPLALQSIWAPDAKSDWDTGWHGDGGFENLSLVTECGTDKLYAIGATGKGFYATNNGVWSLFEVTRKEGAPALRHIANNTRDMYSEECDTRAAGSAFAGRFGELGLYCHQKLQDEDERTSGAACGASLALGFGGLAGYFCTDAVTADRTIRYTEYWPTNPTPEYAAFVDRTLTIMLHSFEGGGGAVGVFDRESGQVCQVAEGGSTQCAFHYPQGSRVTLSPFITSDADSRQTWWSNGCYASNGIRKREGDSFAGDCSVTVDADMTLGLSATTSPDSSNPGSGSGTKPGQPERQPL